MVHSFVGGVPVVDGRGRPKSGDAIKQDCAMGDQDQDGLCKYSVEVGSYQNSNGVLIGSDAELNLDS